LREAHLGDEVQFLEGYAGFWPAPGPGAMVALRGTFRAEGNSLYIRDTLNGDIAANDAAQVGNAYLLNRPSERGLPTPFGPYYAEQTYFDRYGYSAKRVDWGRVLFDLGGMAADWVSGATVGRVINGAQIERTAKQAGIALDVVSLARDGYAAASEALKGQLSGGDAVGLGLDVWGLRQPFWPDLLALLWDLSQGFYGIR
jgi:hypothetical protein